MYKDLNTKYQVWFSLWKVKPNLQNIIIRIMRFIPLATCNNKKDSRRLLILIISKKPFLYREPLQAVYMSFLLSL